jgi:hypothetical protein
MKKEIKNIVPLVGLEKKKHMLPKCTEPQTSNSVNVVGIMQ